MSLKSGSFMIGIVGKNRGEESYGVGSNYVDYFGRIGIPMILPPMTSMDFAEVVKTLDVIVLPGGGDIATYRYDAVPSVKSGNPDQMLEYFDTTNLATALNSNVLVVGICRGFQALAVHYGYQLTQDLWNHPRSETWFDPVHEVHILVHGKEVTRKVNSLHHQGLVVSNESLAQWRASTTGPQLLAWNQEKVTYPVVEAIEGRNFLAVQWHPEGMNDSQFLDWVKYKIQTKKMLTEVR